MGCVHEMEGVAIRKATVCGSEGEPCRQPSVVEEGYYFVVRIAQALTRGAQMCEELSGNRISGKGKTHENFGPRSPIPHKQPIFVNHLFCLSGFAEQNGHGALTDGHIWRINFCEVVSNVVL